MDTTRPLNLETGSYEMHERVAAESSVASVAETWPGREVADVVVALVFEAGKLISKDPIESRKLGRICENKVLRSIHESRSRRRSLRCRFRRITQIEMHEPEDSEAFHSTNSEEATVVQFSNDAPEW